MTALVQIGASPREASSGSLRIAETFLGAYRNVHPSNEIETWDLWNGSLPAFGPAAAAARMAADLEAQPARACSATGTRA